MKLRGYFFLMMAAFIWGTAFVAQMAGMDDLGPFTYAMARYFMGFVFLLLVWLGVRGKRRRRQENGMTQSGWKAGLGAGTIMLIATSLQQVAMVYTTAGKTAFITALYIVLVPLGAVVLGKRIRRENWIGAVLALAGLYLLSLHGAVTLNFGDGLVLLSAFFWAGQILFIDRFALLVDEIELSLAQIFVCWLGSTIAAVAWEDISWPAVFQAWFPIFYGGVMSGGVAFTLQILGQKYADPGPAAIIMSFEACFGAVFSWLLLGEVMSGAQIFGCVMMMAGVLATQSGLFLKRLQQAVSS